MKVKFQTLKFLKYFILFIQAGLRSSISDFSYGSGNIYISQIQKNCSDHRFEFLSRELHFLCIHFGILHQRG